VYRLIATIASVTVLGATPARADCASVIQQLGPLVARISDPKVKELVQLDLKQAHQELLENDEEECAARVTHAAKLMGMP
jgi:hypothetical protein